MDVQDTVIGLDLSTSPIKTVQLYEHTQIQQGKNHHKTPTTDKAGNDKGTKLCGFLQGLSSVHPHPHL